jgi:predicted  nucleic acid-binding Zn-ribbon protein
MTLTETDVRALENEVLSLREELEYENSSAAKLREEYSTAALAGDESRAVMAKQRLDIAGLRINSINSAIQEKECLLDDARGREANEKRLQEARQDFEHASERLAESQAELENLRAEYRALPDRIREAEWRFHEALRKFNEAKQKSVAQR